MGRSVRVGVGRRAATVGLAACVVVGAALPVGAQDDGTAVVDAPEWDPEIVASTPEDDPVAPPFPGEAASAPLLEDEPGEVPVAVFPAAGVSEVVLGESGPAGRAGAAPVTLTPMSEAVRGAELSVEVLDRSVVERTGVSGFVFRIGGAGGEDLGSSLAEAAGTVDGAKAGRAPVELAVEYSGFAAAYGAGFVDRMRVVALPACAVVGPPFPADCDRNGVMLPQHADLDAGELVVQIEDLAALESSTLAADGLVGVDPVEVDDRSGVTATRRTTGATAVEPTPSDLTAEVSGGEETTPTTSLPPSSTTTSPVAASTTTVPAEGTESPAPLEDRAEASIADSTSSTTTSSTSTTSSTTTSSTSTTLAETDATASPPVEEPAGADDQSLGGAGGGVVLALTSGPSGQEGNFAASPLSLTHDWQVGVGSGEFNWSYEVPVPAAPAGGAPSVGLGYSSGAIDGLVSSRNTQAGQAGLGWSEFGSAFIERRYIPCVEEDPDLEIGDLCWKEDNAVISLNGVSSELVQIPVWGTTIYRLRNDPGWRVERRNAMIPNGDNDGEHWVVTTPDGTEYWFGFGYDPDRGNALTHSAWTVPVFGNNIFTDPCSGEGLSWCNQAWRWNLDRVVDPNGNVTTYTYTTETNKYAILNGWGDVSYVRGGRLAAIEYGRRAGSSAPGAARVSFGAQFRCVYLNSDCPAPGPGNALAFPDVPADLVCSSNCLVVSPTFFSGKRYTRVTTEVRVGGGYQPVDEVNLLHQFQDEPSASQKLWLLGIQRIGKVGGNLNLPPVTFLPVWLDNRVDYTPGEGASRMRHPRVGAILDEYAALTEITYGQQRPCTLASHPADDAWDTNTKDCFPQHIKPPGGSEEIAAFHKWLTTTVKVSDLTGGSPPMFNSFNYEGAAAWHHDDDDWVKLADQSWSDWRGYGTVLNIDSQVTRYRLFRGMHGDRLDGGGTKSVSITGIHGTGTYVDDEWLAGLVLDQASYAVDLTTVLAGTLTEYQTRVTANWGPDAAEWARWTEAHTTTSRVSAPVAGFVTQQSIVEYNHDLHLESRYESGWTADPGDERCTLTTYATNPAEHMVAYPASEKMVEGDCTSTEVLSETEWYYDGLTTLGAMGTKGNATRSRARVTEGPSGWLPFTTAGYDALGRATSVTDTKGNTTTTGFTPTTGYPTTSTVTATVTPGLALVTTTNWQIHRGLPTAETDPNGNLTTYAYDPLGRLTRVRQPTEQPAEPGKPPSIEHSYDIDPDREDEPVIRTRRVTSQDLTRFEDAWVVYDSLGRERQTQALSPTAGKVVVAETSYDAFGRVAQKTMPQAVTGTPDDRIGGIAWENSHTFGYDLLGRVTADNYLRGDVEAWDTDTEYTHNSIKVTPPAGGATLSVLDAYGRTVRVEEHDGTAWRATEYAHDLAGNLREVIDPAGNTTVYDYDLLGRRTGQDDPDAGLWDYEYDSEGNQTMVRDAAGAEVHTAYDALGRPTGRHEDSTSGPLLVSWDYDASGELGLVDRSIRHTSTGNWAVDVEGYDARNRPTGTTLTVPASAGGLAGSYTTGYGYDRADRVVETDYPAVGGLPAETVTTAFNTVGLPETLIGEEDYVWSMAYDDRGRPSVRSSGDHTDMVSQGWLYDSDGRLDRLLGATPAPGGLFNVVSDLEFDYDEVGNVEERRSSLDGLAWRECFTHDDRNRMTDAFTVEVADSCDSGVRGEGAAGYDHSYVYSRDGRLTAKTQDGATRDYTYPTGGPGSVRPHTPAEIEGDEYVWDANGQLAERTVGGDTETLAWSPEHLLESITGPAGTTGFTYGPDGERLLRTAPDGTRTLYLEGHEVTAPAGGGAVTATRTYSFGGQLIATRTSQGVDYLLADQQGSIQASVPSGEAAASATRTYLPYGEARSGDGTGFDTGRGWIGQTEDPSSGLAYLNARYYDPTIGIFLSRDPLFDPARPQTLNPYAYGLGNPATHSDPTGLWIPVSNSNSPTVGWDGRVNGGKGGYIGNPYADDGISKAEADRIRKKQDKERDQRRREVQAARDARALRELQAANPDPGFWIALGKAGSGENLILQAMAATGVTPAEWNAIANYLNSGPALNSVAGQFAAPANDAAGQRELKDISFAIGTCGTSSAELWLENDGELTVEFGFEVNTRAVSYDYLLAWSDTAGNANIRPGDGTLFLRDTWNGSYTIPSLDSNDGEDGIPRGFNVTTAVSVEMNATTVAGFCSSPIHFLEG